VANGKIELEIGSEEGDVAYVTLPAHPGNPVPGIVKKVIRLSSVIPGYSGPEIMLDFAEGDELIGIEILG
jgi:hypothetical protein